jgi:hypothetical protein
MNEIKASLSFIKWLYIAIDEYWKALVGRDIIGMRWIGNGFGWDKWCNHSYHQPILSINDMK